CPAGQFATGVNADGTPKCAEEGDASMTNEIQDVITNRGLERDAANNFGLVSTCATSEILKWNGTGWSCAADSDSDVWSAITGGINYPGGTNKVGINDAVLSDTPALLQVGGSGYFANDIGVVGKGTFGGAIESLGGARFPRQPGTNITPGRGPSISLESPSNNVTTSKGTPDFCDIGECPSDNTPSGDIDAQYVCPAGSGGSFYSMDVFLSGTERWHQTITCVAGTDSYSLSTNAGTLEFTNTSGVVKLNLNQNGNVSFFGSLIIPGGSSGNVLTKNADGTASWQPSSSGADQWGTQVVQRDASLKGNGTTGTPLGLMACSLNGQVLKWNGTGWGCAADDSGGGSVWSSPDANGRISYTGGNVGIGTTNPTGKLEINSTQNVTQAAATIYNSDSNTVSGLASGHPIQIGDYITLGGQGPFSVTSRGGASVDISGAFSGTVANQNSYTLLKRNLLGGGNTYAGNIITGKVDANTIQIRTGAAAGKFLKSTDTSGNAVWDTVPAAYTDANVETWAEAKLVDGDFSASPSTAKIKSALLPALAITDTFPITVANSDTPAKCQTAITGLTAANKGDVAICAGINKTYILTVEGGRATFSNWSEIKAPNQVTSVNGQTGAVTININDADANPANELQTLSLSGNTVSISNVSGTGASVTLPPGSKWSDNVAPAVTGINYTGGNVGIGTANPGAKLDVSGGAFIQNSLQSTANPDAGVILSLRNNTLPLGNGDTRFLDFGSLDNSTAFIRPVGRNLSILGGNVGIGTVPFTAGDRLSVLGNTTIGGNLFIGDTNNGAVKNGLQVSGTGDSYFMGKVGIGTSEPATALSIRDGDITIQNRFRLPEEGATVYVYRGYAAGHVTSATIINADGTTANVSGARFDGDTSAIQEHNSTLTYPSGGAGIGTVRFDWYQEESGAINKSAVWRVEQLSSQDPTPARGIVFNDLNSPTAFWSLKNINGGFSFLNGNNASKLSISQNGDITIGGSLDAVGGSVNLQNATIKGDLTLEGDLIGIHGVREFTQVATDSWTVPHGVHLIHVLLVGGGGGGGGGNRLGGGGGGGGGGVTMLVLPVAAEDSISVVVGGGGSGGTSSAGAGSGSKTTVTIGGKTVTAFGGGAGGSGSGGGGGGGVGMVAGGPGGKGGGSGAISPDLNQPGDNGALTIFALGGTGTTNWGGAGGGASWGAGAVGGKESSAGANTGGGGGGGPENNSTWQPGGAGGSGFVRITY
ncbi:MAG: hypothetical protein HYS73_01220, partial [Parcubacteria group bacterium]|nr:hypothetical protein [Parcubacteria group bacterium]